MNSGMEDCTVLDGLITHENRDNILSEYTRFEPAGDGIMELALQNYIEMRDLTETQGSCSRRNLSTPSPSAPMRGCPCIPWSPCTHPVPRSPATWTPSEQAMEMVLDTPEAWGHFEDDRWRPVLEVLDTLTQAKPA